MILWLLDYFTVGMPVQVVMAVANADSTAKTLLLFVAMRHKALAQRFGDLAGLRSLERRR